MGIIITFAIIGMIISYVASKKETTNPFYLIARVVIGAIVAFVVGGFLMQMFSEGAPTKWVDGHSVKLISLRDKSSLEGSFTLGTGSIGEKDYFVFYREWGAGFKKEKIPAEGVIFFEDSTTPTLLVKEKRFTQEWMDYVFIKTHSYYIPSYEFHVPKGTIIQKFAVE